MNLAKTWLLPVVFICENNGYGQMTRMEKVTATRELYKRAEAYDVPAVRVDGNDAFAVEAAAREAVERARTGGGPSFIEAMTYRWREHAEGLEVLFSNLRDPKEIEDWITRDPLIRHCAALAAAGVSASTRAELEQQISTEVDAAVEFARESPAPLPQEALTDVWVDVDVTIMEGVA